jgi:hypothetical protein
VALHAAAPAHRITDAVAGRAAPAALWYSAIESMIPDGATDNAYVYASVAALKVTDALGVVSVAAGMT